MASNDLLYSVQQLQFTAKESAEALLLNFVTSTFPQLEVDALELRPQAISLNSFNGFLKLADGSRVFFKTHVEQDNVISEYYNAEMLAAAGYPVIQPLYSSTNSGQQLLVYPVVDAPSVFDFARQVEVAGAFDSDEMNRLTAAQQASDDALLDLYLQTLQPDVSSESNAPIHQLFWHRLTGGRLARFYSDYAKFNLPIGDIDAETVFNCRWVINSSDYANSLSDLVQRAISVLKPSVHEGLTVIGHGDAHNGNVFLTSDGLVYFDPAFAGRHAPLLDLVKPMFHNVFAMWIYYPQEERNQLNITLEVRNEIWYVEHNYLLNPMRRMFFESKLERTLIPTLKTLQMRDSLRSDWREQVKLALMCCPLLTMNLTGFPPEIALLGLCFAVQMGGESTGTRSYIDLALDRAEEALAK